MSDVTQKIDEVKAAVAKVETAVKTADADMTGEVSWIKANYKKIVVLAVAVVVALGVGALVAHLI